MNAIVGEPLPGRMAKLLSVLSLACFWLLPLSPIIAISAVSLTRRASGWPRNFAVTGAVLCIAYTVIMALIVVRLYLQIR
jgi:predicted lysophospholipase L1 biosynthesis ABC-type transport system permease subunit